MLANKLLEKYAKAIEKRKTIDKEIEGLNTQLKTLLCQQFNRWQEEVPNFKYFKPWPRIIDVPVLLLDAREKNLHGRCYKIEDPFSKTGREAWVELLEQGLLAQLKTKIASLRASSAYQIQEEDQKLQTLNSIAKAFGI